ncbi:neuronal acetylcholine receptor subunit alpha-10 [Plakobranchus ocellatus]|uniref:Neuronal acetylcholine receptor subunit alpha-10 n=1 Tax=Plakobranchus ocellatus TaxID=259542 RepID=A0AAV4CX89_9GAST|nr:neuronal acetylcholine receptor subunit alpha-10 [Plakobranchus ocellatus]
MEGGVWGSRRNLCWLVLAVLINTISLSATGARGSDIPLTGPEHQLYLDLFESYNLESRPVKNASHSVTITFALGLNQLLDLDEKNQVLTTSVWIYEEWRDEMLTWSPSKYDGQSALMIPATTIWLPDIFIFNTAGPNMNGFVNVSGSKVSIQHDGNVKWMIPLMVASACAVDVTYFPYDRQSCEIKFGSWIYDIDQLNIVVDSDQPDLEHYVMNSEYDLENVSLHRGVLDSSCCPGGGQHPMVGLTVNLRRKSLYYDYIVIAPTIMLCVMTLASFLLPCDRGEKMNIGLTVFLTLYVLQLRIADNVPDTNSTPILGVFMLVVMTFNCVSLIMATIVMNIKKLGDDNPCPDVPRWLFALCQHVLGRAVCTPYLWTGDASPAINGNRITTRGIENKSEAPLARSTSDTGQNSAAIAAAASSAEGGTRVKLQGKELKKCTDGSRNLDKHCFKVKKDQTPASGKMAEHVENLRYPEEVIHGFKSGDLSSDTADEIQDPKGLSEKEFGVRQRRQPKSIERIPAVNTSGDKNFWPLYDQSADDPNLETNRAQQNTTRGFLMKRRWFYVAEVVDKFLFVVYLVLLTCSIFTVLFLIPVYFRNES